ncbi:hypothetical protein TIFTF001_012747 [Ficus carica]|uniref:Uncharacterized protein n=1 Tax=Ficus carica TaxID=3494 RepID=A0AA88AGI5_FICCA|nr:hypothetical protein TIFTF001_012747 [Ficus carica]
MRNTIRCCISCILPCGALDVVRIVHSNGRVEEISGTVRASEVMKAHPKHVLKKPSTSSPSEDGVVPKIVIVPPDAELQRGKIYFLMPLPPSSVPPEKKARQRSSSSPSAAATAAKKKRMRDGGHGKMTTSISTDNHYHHHHRHRHRGHQSNGNNNSSSANDYSTTGTNTTSTTASIAMANVNLLISDQYLSEILSEKLSTQRDRRRGRAGVWRPHLESISESPTDGC